MMAKWGGGEVLRRAVRGMLPKNRLRDDRMARLKCFEGERSPYQQNIVRIEGVGSGIGGIPEVKEAFARQEGASLAAAL